MGYRSIKGSAAQGQKGDAMAAPDDEPLAKLPG